MQKILFFFVFASLVFVLGFISKSPVIVNETEEGIKWVSIEEAEELAKKDGKKILVDVYTDWCGWCKKMDKATYEHAEVISYVNENFHAVKFNAEQREDVTVKGNTFKYIAQGRRGYHELAASMLQGKLGYPATVFLDSEFNMLTHISGYRGPDEMMAFLSYFKDELYAKEVSLQTYIDSYKKSR